MTTQNVNIDSVSLTNYAVGNITTTKTVSNKKINLYNLFWIFFIGSVAGFIVETIWCLFRSGTIESRSSVIFAPINAVYGIGALALYLIGKHLTNKNLIHIFVFGTIAGTIVEYVCSFIQETLFGSVSWDYSGQFMNIRGRVCLLYSVFWGLLAILWFVAIQPLFEKMIIKIPSGMYRPLTWSIAVFLVLITAVSIAAVTRWGLRLEGIPAYSIIGEFLDKVFSDGFMKKMYPNMIW